MARPRSRVQRPSAAQHDSQVPTCMVSAPYDVYSALELRTWLPRSPTALPLDFTRTRLCGRVSTTRAVSQGTEGPTRALPAAHNVYRRPEGRLGSHCQPQGARLSQSRLRDNAAAPLQPSGLYQTPEAYGPCVRGFAAIGSLRRPGGLESVLLAASHRAPESPRSILQFPNGASGFSHLHTHG